MLTACQVPVISLLSSQSLASPSAATCLELPLGNQLIRLALADIVRLEGAGNYTYIYTRDQRRYLSSKTLKRLELLLTDPVFCRVHKSSIINLAYLTEVNFGPAPHLCLAGSQPIAVSRRRLASTRRRVKKYHHQANGRLVVA
ncbi:LytR/AlgR family response regulator transcription factor [Fibrella forsythiae]|uniref:LytTR family transcriptional regulator n=1 Tax=Fibrella forsythiae TaxID=2817061 RepID=A0ABS3JST6_9BACT|nr:LytTR family DNA-binding domain-containing protein [Fibrella forsythiae]MBO0953065.1 LytTR family transcriptional regulator [Fibrella forsythiae]